LLPEPYQPRNKVNISTAITISRRPPVTIS
jgi:hypothetical protein